ncbi:MAG: methyl-accepting chemotaxis protein [Alistipes sp.]|nr:methyl-accepting chemotaxis protein [Candidatus Alistipes equi]
MKGISKRISISFISIIGLLLLAGYICLAELSGMSYEAKGILATENSCSRTTRDILRLVSIHSDITVQVSVMKDYSKFNMLDSLKEQMVKRLDEGRKIMSNAHYDSIRLNIEHLNTLSKEYVKKHMLADSLSHLQGAHIGHGQSNRASIEKRYEWYSLTYNNLQHRLEKLIYDFYEDVNKTLHRDVSELRNNAYRSVLPVFITIMVMIVLILLLHFFIVRLLVTPIKKMNVALKNYMRFSMPFLVKIDRVDEVAELADNIKRVSEEMTSYKKGKGQ